MLGSSAGPGGASQRGLWPLAPAPAPPVPNFTADSFGRYGVYSLFPGGPSIGGALYSHASTIGRYASGMPPTSGPPFHNAHKESLFSSGYTFGSPTPPPGSPYSPVAATQLELLTKGYNSNIIIHQPDFSLSPKKYQVHENRCEEKCYSVKSEKQCSCQNSPVKYKLSEVGSGCSRTNPIDWSLANVKKEPGSTPCQVAEITTSISPVIKVEVTSPSQKNSDVSVSTTNGNIPIGIALARQRIHHQDIVSSASLPPTGLLTTVNTTTHIKEFSRLSEIDSSPGMAASTTTGVAGGGAVLQCTEDRTAGLAGWSVGGSHNSTIATPTLWQYPAAMPVEPMVPLSVPPMGVQLIRDPSSGHLLLLPTTGIEHLQQAVVWPSYHQSPSLFIPPLAPPPLQLLSSASSDYLSTSTTLHQHTQTHSTRLLALTTDSKRKLPLPATTLIKIETDAATLDQSKALQAVSTISSNTGTVFTEQNMAPLVTTHVIYQHPTNLVLSQTSSSDTPYRSQAISPVSYLTPPPEINLPIEEESPGVQDASNQTDTPLYSEDDNTCHTICEVVPDAKAMMTKENVEENSVVPETQSQSSECDEEILDDSTQPQIVINNNEENTNNVQTIPKPDLSGLELLSNSIVEFEKIREHSNISVKLEQTETGNEKQNDKILQGIQDMSIKDKETDAVIINAVDDKLGGLDLLCALAEQRFNEEVINNNAQKEKSKNRDSKREKRKAKHADESFIKRKKFKSEHRKRHEERKSRREFERTKKFLSKETFNEHDNCSETNISDKCSCEDIHRTYKSRESEEEVRKFIASKSQTNFTKDDWPEMNLLELNMRMKLADLQRQYKEKQKELNKLKPKRKSLDEKESKKIKSRKKSTFSERDETPPPVLDKMNVPVTPNKCELLKPPTLCAITNQNSTQSVTNVIINCEDKSIIKESYYSSGPDFSDSSPEKVFLSSSKKRKVGRPKKLLSTSGELTATETIVAKKPKTGSFVSYLLAAKQKLQTQAKEAPIFDSSSPPRYVEETKKHKLKKVKNGAKKFEETVSSKIRPKLKAEPTVKTYLEEDEAVNDWEAIETEETTQEICNDNVQESNVELEKECDVVSEKQPQEEVKEDPVLKVEDTRCVLTGEHLEKEKMRVLTAMGGLFYAGHLNAVEPPDVYSIILDGERGNRPHIMSREEILRDAIVEVAPASTTELITGTRVCAYWSQQYRCLYPGTVAEPGTPDPTLDSKFVSVEFDDGDSGRIAMEDIRYLPSDYPFVEYDPNPLLSLSKRRRRVSSINSVSLDERRVSCSSASQLEQVKVKSNEIAKDNEDKNTLELLNSKHQERKRLKKKKREKLKEKLNHEDKKKRRKCKCGDQHCKRKKHGHKRHRKHKKRYHVELMENEENAVQIKTNGDLPVESKESNEEEPDSDVLSEKSLSSEIEIDDVNVNVENEVTIDDILNSKANKKLKKRDRQESSESRSKMTAFLHKKQLWSWAGKGYKRSKIKGRTRKEFFKEICRDKESITVGDSAVFLSTNSPERPYIGKIQAMWESAGSMAVKVKWFYHPEETTGCPILQYPGGLFESPHEDENDVQTISHKCEVLPLKEFKQKLGDDSKRYAAIYDNNDIYYLAGYYDPGVKTLKMQPDIPCN